MNTNSVSKPILLSSIPDRSDLGILLQCMVFLGMKHHMHRQQPAFQQDDELPV